MAARIPAGISDFFNYVEITDNYLQEIVTPPNGERLDLTDPNVTKWHDLAGEGAALYLDKKDPLKKGTYVNKKVVTFMGKFKIFAQPQLNIIAASLNATMDDAAVFNIVLVNKTATRIFPGIAERCYAMYKWLGGGKIGFACRTITNSKRPKLAEGADAVEIAYILGDKDTKAPSADEIVLRKMFSKATFILPLGTINSGKILYIYFRWINRKHPEVASPWSELQIIPIV